MGLGSATALGISPIVIVALRPFSHLANRALLDPRLGGEQSAGSGGTAPRDPRDPDKAEAQDASGVVVGSRDGATSQDFVELAPASFTARCASSQSLRMSRLLASHISLVGW